MHLKEQTTLQTELVCKFFSILIQALTAREVLEVRCKLRLIIHKVYHMLLYNAHMKCITRITLGLRYMKHFRCGVNACTKPRHAPETTQQTAT